MSRAERSGFRDGRFVDFMERNGLYVPYASRTSRQTGEKLTWADMVAIEYDNRIPRILVFYFNDAVRVKPLERGIVNLSLPCMGVLYREQDDVFCFDVSPLNGAAKNLLPSHVSLNEEEFVRNLYQWRGRPYTEDASKFQTPTKIGQEPLISRRHHAWGKNCPTVDLDLLLCGSVSQAAVAVLEFKCENPKAIHAQNANRETLERFAQTQNLALFIVLYKSNFRRWNVWAVGKKAYQWMGQREVEIRRKPQFIKFLNQLSVELDI